MAQTRDLPEEYFDSASLAGSNPLSLRQIAKQFVTRNPYVRTDDSAQGKLSRILEEKFPAVAGLTGRYFGSGEETLSDTPGAPSTAFIPKSTKDVGRMLTLMQDYDIQKPMKNVVDLIKPRPENRAAKAFMQARFEEFADKMPIHEYSDYLDPMAKGFYAPKGSMLKTYQETGMNEDLAKSLLTQFPEPYTAISRGKIDRPISSRIETMGHELGHGWEDVLGRLPINPKYKDYQEYWNSPQEVFARQTGRKSMQAYDDFYKLVSKTYLDDIASDIIMSLFK